MSQQATTKLPDEPFTITIGPESYYGRFTLSHSQATDAEPLLILTQGEDIAAFSPVDTIQPLGNGKPMAAGRVVEIAFECGEELGPLGTRFLQRYRNYIKTGTTQTADEIIAAGVPMDHTPKWDYDLKTITIGDLDPSHDFRMPRTEIKIERGVCLAAKDDSAESLGGWKHADLTVSNSGSSFRLFGLSEADVRDLSEFLADYAERLRRW